MLVAPQREPMFRPALLAAAASLGFTVSCVGTMEEKFPHVSAHDASPFADADPLAPDADIPGCTPLGDAPSDGYHFPGEDCIACHRQAGGAPPFTIGGTLYTDEQGSAPVAGATIVVDDSTGNRLEMITEVNGNFYSIDPISFPVRTYVAVCPDVVPMITDVPLASASCNTASCHSAGFRVHLP